MKNFTIWQLHSNFGEFGWWDESRRGEHPRNFRLADANFSDFAGGSGFFFSALGGDIRRDERGRNERDARAQFGRHTGAGACGRTCRTQRIAAICCASGRSRFFKDYQLDGGHLGGSYFADYFRTTGDAEHQNGAVRGGAFLGGDGRVSLYLSGRHYWA